MVTARYKKAAFKQNITKRLAFHKENKIIDVRIFYREPVLKSKYVSLNSQLP